jgi:hypothetical protein
MASDGQQDKARVTICLTLLFLFASIVFLVLFALLVCWAPYIYVQSAAGKLASPVVVASVAPQGRAGRLTLDLGFGGCAGGFSCFGFPSMSAMNPLPTLIPSICRLLIPA